MHGRGGQIKRPMTAENTMKKERARARKHIAIWMVQEQCSLESQFFSFDRNSHSNCRPRNFMLLQSSQHDTVLQHTS
jgi:hypothetical protein